MQARYHCCPARINEHHRLAAKTQPIFNFFFKLHPVAPHSSIFICPEQSCGVATPGVRSVGTPAATEASGSKPLGCQGARHTAAHGSRPKAPHGMLPSPKGPQAAFIHCPQGRSTLPAPEVVGAMAGALLAPWFAFLAEITQLCCS